MPHTKEGILFTEGCSWVGLENMGYGFSTAEYAAPDWLRGKVSLASQELEQQSAIVLIFPISVVLHSYTDLIALHISYSCTLYSFLHIISSKYIPKA